MSPLTVCSHSWVLMILNSFVWDNAVPLDDAFQFDTTASVTALYLCATFTIINILLGVCSLEGQSQHARLPWSPVYPAQNNIPDPLIVNLFDRTVWLQSKDVLRCSNVR